MTNILTFGLEIETYGASIPVVSNALNNAIWVGFISNLTTYTIILIPIFGENTLFLWIRLKGL